MDNLTHTLTGILLSRAGLDRYYRKPALLLALAANAPDIDIVAASQGSLAYFHYHRWITHSVLFLPVMAGLTTLLVCALRRSWAGVLHSWLLASIGVASHLVLDWTNAYGVRLLAPWSDHWYRGDLASVIDPWIWAALLLGVLAPMLGRMVSAEMGARPGSGRVAAMLALGFLTAYDGGRSLLHARALETLNSRLYDDAPPARLAAFPEAANPFAWGAVVETISSYKLYDLNLLDNFDPGDAQVVYKPEPSPAIQAARATRTFRVFLPFCEFPLWTVLPAGDAARPETEISVREARFGFSATALVDAKARVLKQWFGFGPPRL